MRRMTVGMLMGFVILIALGLASLVRPTAWTVRLTTIVMWATGACAVVGACSRARSRAIWRGVAVGFWGYLGLQLAIESVFQAPIGTFPPTRWITRRGLDWLHPEPIASELPESPPWPDSGVAEGPAYEVATGQPGLVPAAVRFHTGWQVDNTAFFQQRVRRYITLARANEIAESLWALVFGFVGAVVASFLTERRAQDRASNAPNSEPHLFLDPTPERPEATEP